MDEENFKDFGMPNKELGAICKGLFYKEGQIGLYNLAENLSCPNKELEAYFDALNVPVQEGGLEQ